MYLFNSYYHDNKLWGNKRQCVGGLWLLQKVKTCPPFSFLLRKERLPDREMNPDYKDEQQSSPGHFLLTQEEKLLVCFLGISPPSEEFINS